MAQVSFDPFEALGLPRDASTAAIKSRYHALARKYHPNGNQGPDESKTALSEHFYHINEAWKLLSKEDVRRRTVQVLRLLELQEELVSHFADLLENDDQAEPPAGQTAPSINSDLDPDHHTSSDADEDLPNVGINRRQTVLKRGTQPFGGSLRNAPSNGAPDTNAARIPQLFVSAPSAPHLHRAKSPDFSARRRKKLEKLRREELEAFLDYRDSMIAKFEIEEEATRRHEQYERAKWRREYFERAPKESSERMRSFQHVIGAVRAFGSHQPKKRNRSALNLGWGPSSTTGNNQFLTPDHGLLRRNTAHRRGWSNDISGDQTSSEDDPVGSSALRSISPNGARNFYFTRTRSVPFGGISGSRPASREETLEAVREPQGPFKLVIKRPTEKGKISDAGDSSGDAISGSSRPSSPPVPSTDNLNFTMLPSSGIADLFGLAGDSRARSTSPRGHHRRHSLPNPELENHNHSAELCQFSERKVRTVRFRNIPMAHVHVLTLKEKASMLEAEPDNYTDPFVLLDRLRHLNQAGAAKFMVKPDSMESFNFRLIYDHRDVAKQRHTSFIALSYRRKLHVEKHSHHFTLPLEPDMLQAVWDEKLSEDEGVWIDQICIDQDSDREKTVSMSAMDMVYRSARLVVVALDDIELESHEGKLLQNHMDEYARMIHVSPRQRFRRKQPPYLDTHEELYGVVRKLLRSSWFRRAWCRHEMRLAKTHIFLIPCKSPGSWTGKDVLRLNGKCIAHLLALSTEVPFETDVESVKPALHAFFRDRGRITSDETVLKQHHGNFTTVVAEVFDMEAGGDPRIPEEQRASDARKDKVSIVLNTMECGLALCDDIRDPAVHVSLHECYHDLLLLALAAQDPGALCSVGGPLTVAQPGVSGLEVASTWMYTPTVSDSGLDNAKTLPQLPGHAKFETDAIGNCQYVQLDLKFLQSSQAIRPTEDPETLNLARYFKEVCEERRLGRNRKRYLLRDRRANRLFGPMSDVYVETLACVFHCGPDWMKNVCQRYSMSRWKVDLQGAYELLVALRNTHGKWPSNAWSERAAGFIMDFVHFLVIRGMPSRQLTKPEKWRPIWTPTEEGGKVLTFVPLVHDNARPAVPMVLSHPDYVHLARLWMLEPRSTTDPDADGSEWTLLGKSVLFLDEISIERMNMQWGEVYEQQKVFGRHFQPSNEGVREDISES